MSILSIENLSKRFGGNTVIDNLTLRVPEGAIYGFLGPNGAGKTTTMKMVLGLLKPDGGIIEVCGEPVRYGQTATNRNIGFLPDVPEFYGYMKPMEYLALCAEVTGLDRPRAKEKSGELLGLVGLERANKRIGGFSRGMKQRLGIAQALLNEPGLLICDEPTSALDPIGRREILDILLSIKGRTTIVFSTHILSDVERICDHVAVLNAGRLALNGTLADLKRGRRQDALRVEFTSPADMEAVLAQATVAPYAKDCAPEDRAVTLKSEDIAGAQKALYGVFAARGIYPEKVEVLEPTLESLFMEVVK